VIFIVVERRRDGGITPGTLEAVAAAQSVSGDVPIVAAVLGAAWDPTEDLLTAGVTEVVVAAHPVLTDYTPDGWVAALEQVLDVVAPALVLVPHSYQARDFVAKLAARRSLALITDATAVEGPLESLRVVRPLFQGRLVALVRRPQGGTTIVSLQAGAWRADAVRRGPAAPVRSVPLTLGQVRQTPEPPFREARQSVDLAQAERIVAVGRGIKDKEGLAVAERLATALGAEVAASRPICDNGWLPMDRQVGSSGQTVAPRLYVALGISGAIQHLVGMRGARTIVAVNKDADAPIFEVADYGIVGDLFEVVPAIVSELAKGDSGT
jgi:electron transfer flavoprotein alpha subunit